MFTALEDFDFQLLGNKEFKEDSVREEIIRPILKELGYSAGGLNRIVRSKSLKHPFVKIGSQERSVRIIPDYLLLVSNKPAWTLDAKAPTETITSGQHVEQTYSYAIHPEVRTHFFALCNGREFAVFEVDNQNPALYFHISEMDDNWGKLNELLSPKAFQAGRAILSKKMEHTFGGGGFLRPCKASSSNQRLTKAKI